MPSPDPQLVSLLQDLTRIESVNPSLSKTGSGERAMALYLQKYCEERGLACELQEVKDGRPNLVAWVPGTDPDRRILFIAHTDTVPVEKWEDNPFSGDIRDGLLHGRGSCDTKGSLAAMLRALCTLGARKPKATVVLVASIDEEYRKIGARAVADSGVAYEAAVVGEPTSLELVVAHKGSVRWQVEVEGIPVHSSRPHLGVNAITGMARIILALEELNRNLSLRENALVGPPALTVSLIEGGIELTTVPPACRIWIDRRLTPGESPQGAIQEVEDILKHFRESEYKIIARSLLPALEDPAPLSAEGSRIAEVASLICKDVAGTGRFTGAPWGTDASQLAGVSCVVIGPGSMAQAHTSNEYITLDQLDYAVQIYQRIMLEY
ncbi:MULTISPECIES: M20 family metallopeptidase [unclassified Mesorhizobium]|uniref:M20 family metallopeptidase n=1 Tax=unclassified Mesorhizobium TaxID=325217 RepID=UPI001926B1F0|nr:MULTISPECIES: M20 family metallopeptidase [unclassified Mesorhizobium]BCG82908.1 acetylornithine deacetylase [Mesorhizobium sp. 113-3-3]BCG90785.1 acetylornithine deacetylase [Mesorhizobium sp. 113-3-9]